MFQYSQHRPPPDLRPWIRLVWTMTVDEEPADASSAHAVTDVAELVVPDGHAELIFNLGEPFHQQAPGHDTFRAQPSAILNGQLRGSVLLRATGRVQLVGIRVQPWALGALARVSASSLTDNWQPTSGVAAPLLPDLEDELRGSNACQEAPGIVMRHLRAQLRNMKAPSERAVTVVSHVADNAAWLDLSAIRNNVGMSERAMQRLFDAEVGLTTKQFAKVVRVQQAVRFRREDGGATWARAALEAGYYDQSHFNKDFRSVVGCRPTELIVEPETMTGSLLSAADE